MGLIHVLDREGREVLIWSGDIAPEPRPARANGRWEDVWVRQDAETPRNASISDAKARKSDG